MTNDAETSPEQLEYDLDHPENLTLDEISEYLKALIAARARIAELEHCVLECADVGGQITHENEALAHRLAEVERERDELLNVDINYKVAQERDAWRNKHDDLRRQLAEAQALLQEQYNFSAGYLTPRLHECIACVNNLTHSHTMNCRTSRFLQRTARRVEDSHD